MDVAECVDRMGHEQHRCDETAGRSKLPPMWMKAMMMFYITSWSLEHFSRSWSSAVLERSHPAPAHTSGRWGL